MIKNMLFWNRFEKGKIFRIALIAIIVIGFGLLFKSNILERPGEQQFVDLADAFLHGKLYFLQDLGNWGDTSKFLGHYYWPLGPFPAVILMPFVALFGIGMEQGYLSFFLNLLNFFLLYRIARQVLKNDTLALLLAFGYIFSTTYLYVALKPWSWYYAQVVVTSCVLLALHEFFHRKRWFLIGIFMGLAVITRVNLFLGLIFFLLALYDESLHHKNTKQTVTNLLSLLIPVVVTGLILLFYNFFRFGNVLEFGYNFQLLYNEPAANREYGLWSLVHFPANIYYFLLKGPDAVFLPDTKILTYPFLKPDIWGMSILFSSPILLWVLSAPWKEKMVKYATITSLVILFSLLGYYGIGVRQYGYRYALDLYPFLFVILAYAVKTKLYFLFVVILFVSFLFNYYLIPFV